MALWLGAVRGAELKTAESSDAWISFRVLSNPHIDLKHLLTTYPNQLFSLIERPASNWHFTQPLPPCTLCRRFIVARCVFFRTQRRGNDELTKAICCLTRSLAAFSSTFSLFLSSMILLVFSSSCFLLKSCKSFPTFRRLTSFLISFWMKVTHVGPCIWEAFFKSNIMFFCIFSLQMFVTFEELHQRPLQPELIITGWCGDIICISHNKNRMVDGQPKNIRLFGA